MNTAFWLIPACLLMLVGMIWLALAKPVHWKQVLGAQANHGRHPVKALQRAGAISLLLSALACLAADHPSMAVLVWIMLLALSTFITAMILSWRPHWLQALITVRRLTQS